MVCGVADAVTVYEDALLRVLLFEKPLGLQLIGRADISHRGRLEDALRHVERDAGDLFVDLADLEYIEVGGARALIDHVGVLETDGREVRITGVRPGVLQVLRVCMLTRHPNLRIEDARVEDATDICGEAWGEAPERPSPAG